MITQYVLKGFNRHKARTAIMVLALLVVSAMLVSLNNGVESLQRQIVEIVERFAGEHDITIQRIDTSPDQFVDVAAVQASLAGADPTITAIYPRFMTTVEVRRGTQLGNASLVARAPEDHLGQITMLEGEYNLEGNRVVVLQVTADTFGLKVGDEIDLSYILPVSRMTGQELPAADSVNRANRRFTVSGIALATGLGGGSQNGILANVATVQDWLGVSGQAERLVVVLDSAVYSSANTQTAIFRVRRIAEQLYATLGADAADYTFALEKAQALDYSDVAFAILRSVSSVYGLLVMGVVGLLIYSIINTNVEERRRDLAFLRILGAKQHHLFALVMIEVAFIGLLGVGLGIVVGQLFSIFVIAPIANVLIATSGGGMEELGVTFKMTITAAAMAQTAVIAGTVLLLSALAPARKAARTKIRYAINPGSADNLQIEDLARLRSRKFDMRIVIAGVVLTVMWLLVFIGSNYLFVQGNEAVISIFLFTGLALLVIGISLLFYALTVPFERILVLLSEAVLPRLAFFAGPNLIRAKQRNTVISLMVVFSATLPTFLGTMTALEQRNYDTDARFRSGAPITAEISPWARFMFNSATDDNLRPDALDEFRTIPGIAEVVGLSKAYVTSVTNRVTLRQTRVQIHGLTDPLYRVAYADLTTYAAGGPEMFDTILSAPDTIILSAGYAEYMDVRVGDIVRITGAGRDHIVEMEVVGLLERIPGFESFSRNQNYIRDGSSIGFVSLNTYLRLTHDPNNGYFCVTGLCSAVERDQMALYKVLILPAAGANESEIVTTLRETFSERAALWIQSTAEDIRSTEQSMRTMRVLMLIMTTLSFVTSIFGVFAVVYVAVYVRRMEIGMLKAIGMPRRALVGAFALEAVMMTVSASLAGVTAGTVLGYLFYITNNMMRNVPMRGTFDWLTTIAILIMVVLASVISAAWGARSTVRRKVTQILREAW